MRILVVEDHPLIADDLCETLMEHGVDPVGPANTLLDGIRFAHETQLDGALLDIDLGRDRVWPLADRLIAASVPFAFVSGRFLADELPARFAGRPCYDKPATETVILQALDRIRKYGPPG